MKLAITARKRTLFDRYSVRIAIGVLLSLFVHGFILSLQLGLPGIGLPGLGFPWSERHAQTPELSIRIANMAGSPTIRRVDSPAPIDSKVEPKPEEAVTLPNQVVTGLPAARVRQAPSATNTVASKTAKALKSTPANANAIRQTGSPPPEDQSAPAPADSQTRLITLTGDYPDTFSVPAPDLDDWWRDAPKFDVTPMQIRPPEQLIAPAIALASPKQTIQQAQDPAPAVQKPAEQESFERPDNSKAEQQKQGKPAEVATEEAERQKGEEIAAQEATREQKELEAAQRARDEETREEQETARAAEEAERQIAAKKLEEENIARLEQEAAEKKLEEDKLLKQQEADRQAKELAAQKQAEEIANQKAAALALQKQMEEQQQQEAQRQEEEKAAKAAIDLAARQAAEEAARQKAAELEKQKEEEKLVEERKAAELAEQQKAQELAAQQKAQELAAQQKAAADAAAAAQRETARIAAAAASNSNGNGANGANGYQPRGSANGDLASRALDQVGKIDLDRIAPPSNQPEEDSRRRSIFGMVDHDVVVDAYIRSWRNKIERNGSLNYSQSSKDLAREDPVVTVSVRSDGSVEQITFNRSSGRSDLDEAVRRIVRINAPYSVFPDTLARKYPVIEIRRVWNFSETLHLLEEVH